MYHMSGHEVTGALSGTGEETVQLQTDGGKNEGLDTEQEGVGRVSASPYSTGRAWHVTPHHLVHVLRMDH